MEIKTLEKRYEFSKYVGDKFIWFAVSSAIIMTGVKLTQDNYNYFKFMMFFLFVMFLFSIVFPFYYHHQLTKGDQNAKKKITKK